MDRYVDGFVLPVKEENVEEYRTMATEACESWLDHGALAYVEAVGDDLAPEPPEAPDGEEWPAPLRFTDLVDADGDETVVFAYIVFESREHRDEVNEAVMADPAMQPDAEDDAGDAMAMPFDAERMAYGGFRSLVFEERVSQSAD